MHIRSISLPRFIMCCLIALSGPFVSNAADARPSLSGLQQEIDALEAEVEQLRNQLQAEVNVLEAAKQDEVFDFCPPGFAIRVINEDGTVVCESDDDTDTDTDTTYSAGDGLTLSGTTFTPADGYASIPAHAFHSIINLQRDQDLCVLRRSQNSFVYFIANFVNAFIECDAIAAIQLPNGARYTRLDCFVVDRGDGSISNSLLATLYRTRIGVEEYSEVVFQTASSVDSINFQMLSDTQSDTLDNIVDNFQFTYHILMDWSSTNFNDLGSDSRIYGCRVGYTYQ